MPEVGDIAPDFELKSHLEKDKKVKLSDFRGQKNVVIAFYPLAGPRSERPRCPRTRPTSNASRAMMLRCWASQLTAFPAIRPGPRVSAVFPTIFSATFILKAKWPKRMRRIVPTM